MNRQTPSQPGATIIELELMFFADDVRRIHLFGSVVAQLFSADDLVMMVYLVGHLVELFSNFFADLVGQAVLVLNFLYTSFKSFSNDGEAKQVARHELVNSESDWL